MRWQLSSLVTLGNLLRLMGSSTELTSQQTEARRNTVSSLVAGIASSAGMSAATASTAATLETTNNAVILPLSLRSRQQQRRRQPSVQPTPVVSVR